MLFNKPCSKKDYEKICELEWSWFDLTMWISEADMTAAEKETNPFYKTTGGYLKTIPYKEAWEKCPKSFIEKVKKLKNFNKKVFKEITGLSI